VWLTTVADPIVIPWRWGNGSPDTCLPRGAADSELAAVRDNAVTITTILFVFMGSWWFVFFTMGLPVLAMVDNLPFWEKFQL
jgi:hypothetical protein